jgi:hypothetical protein
LVLDLKNIESRWIGFLFFPRKKLVEGMSMLGSERLDRLSLSPAREAMRRKASGMAITGTAAGRTK